MSTSDEVRRDLLAAADDLNERFFHPVFDRFYDEFEVHPRRRFSRHERRVIEGLDLWALTGQAEDFSLFVPVRSRALFSQTWRHHTTVEAAEAKIASRLTEMTNRG